MSESAAATAPRKSAGVLRRFGAMLYDTLLVIALMMVVTAAFLPFTGGAALGSARFGTLRHVYQAVLLLVPVLFFGVFWTRRGQTLGMMAWRIKVERADGSALTWRDVPVRLGGALVSFVPFALGYFWIWLDRERLAWHDRWSRTRVVVVEKKKHGSPLARAPAHSPRSFTE